MRWTALVGPAAAAMVAAAALGAGNEPTVAPGPETTWVKEGERPLLEYANGGSLFKPYVRQFFSPAGVNVLRDNVADHVHHHGLMFAVGVEGVDFWSETPASGRQVHRSPNTAPTAAVGSGQAMGLVQLLDWVAPGDEKALAQESRAIAVLRDPALGASLLVWRTRLEPGGGRASVKVAGSHYFGLGMRLAKSMDNVGEFFTARGKVDGEIVRGDERLTRGTWCACAAEADGKPVTVAMFDHPANVRPAWWFTMAKPFAYMSATLNLHREPLTVEAGKPLTLRYGAAVWDGKVKPDEIEKLYRRWVDIATPKTETKAP